MLLKQSYSCELFFSLLFFSLSLGELEASGDCSSVRHKHCCQGPSPGLLTGGFLLDLLSKRESILADTLPSDSPLGSVDTLVFFPGSFTLAVGSTSTQMSKHTQMLVRNTSDEGGDGSQACLMHGVSHGTFFFVCLFLFFDMFLKLDNRVLRLA